MSENKNTWVSTAADKLLLLLLLLLLLPAFSQFFLCCTAYFHKSTKPSHFHIPALSFPLLSPPPSTSHCLFAVYVCSWSSASDFAQTALICMLRFLSVFAWQRQRHCVYACASVCVCVCVRVCWLHGAQHWVNTLAAARAVYVVDVNTIASWQILLETFEFSQFGLASRLLFNNWMALQLAAFSWL